MQHTTQLTTELQTGEETYDELKNYRGVWGAEVTTADGAGVVVELDPYAERDIKVILKDGHTFWYNLNEVEVKN